MRTRTKNYVLILAKTDNLQLNRCFYPYVSTTELDYQHISNYWQACKIRHQSPFRQLENLGYEIFNIFSEVVKKGSR